MQALHLGDRAATEGARASGDRTHKVRDLLREGPRRRHFHGAHVEVIGILAPFSTWDSKQPTQSLQWYAAYNFTKHDREANLNKATLNDLVTLWRRST